MRIVLWIMVVFWFLHLFIGTGAGYAILRLWPSRHNPFVLRVAIYLHAMVIEAVVAIVLVFMAKGVKLNWKFAITWFVGAMLMDMCRIPLIVYVIKGNGKARQTET